MAASLTRRPLWQNILFALILVVVFFVLFMASLRWITKHGESKTVPAITGKPINEVESILEKSGFDLVVQDSVFYDSVGPGVVLKQVPEGDEIVKVNRTVYVTINRFTPPDVSMPNLVGYSYRNAEMALINLGLKVGDTTYRVDFAKNSVLDQRFHGKPLKVGDKVKMGSAIDLVLGSGLGNEDMAMPRLTGLTLSEAKMMVEQAGLIMGSVIETEPLTDKDNAFVVRQSPQALTTDGLKVRIRPGQMVDLWLANQPPAVDSAVVMPPAGNP